MKGETLLQIWERIENLDDAEELAEEFSVHPAVIETILFQKKVESTRANYHQLAASQKNVLKAWEEGKSIVEIAGELGFMPVMVARVLLMALGYSKKKLKFLLKEPEQLKDRRLGGELRRAVEEDYIYSPLAHRFQEEKASLGEALIARWLYSRGVEALSQGDYVKQGEMLTPDFLVSGLKVRGREIGWIESKALFGTTGEHRRYFRRQYSKYIKSFGEGMVVYWYGYEESVRMEEGLTLVDYSFFNHLHEELFALRWKKWKSSP